MHTFLWDSHVVAYVKLSVYFPFASVITQLKWTLKSSEECFNFKTIRFAYNSNIAIILNQNVVCVCYSALYPIASHRIVDRSALHEYDLFTQDAISWQHSSEFDSLS